MKNENAVIHGGAVAGEIVSAFAKDSLFVAGLAEAQEDGGHDGQAEVQS